MDELDRRKVTTALAMFIADWAQGKLTVAQARRRLQKALTYLDQLEKPPEPEQGALRLDGEPEEKRSDAVLLFEHWQMATDRPKAQYTPGRARIIAARLKRFSLPQLKRVISWGAREPFFRGQNDRHTRYDTIETLLRSDEKVERYLERAGPEQLTLVDEETIGLEARTIAAGDRGDWDEYERLNAQLADKLARK